MSVEWIFKVLCCPPWPKSIARKLAFHPPMPSTYCLISDDEGATYQIEIADYVRHSCCKCTQKVLTNTEYIKKYTDVCITKTKLGNEICVVFVTRPEPVSRYTILFSHGNSIDLGASIDFFVSLGKRLNVNICGYDYSGYGVSDGEPTEQNIYYDIEAAYSLLLDRYNVKAEDIVLYGQSIGTVPTMDLGSKFEVAAVVLQAPLVSGMRVLCPGSRRNFWCDSFKRYVRTL